MRVSCLVTVVCFVAGSILPAAPPQSFPYEAVVQRDGVEVRSGPGERFDPTMKLPSGQRVTVHRHEPGGWFVIDPPPGSFSWIRADYVETTGDGRGVVKAPPSSNGLPPRVAVWVGSQFSSEHRITARQLASGDEVTIIGEETHPTDQGPQRFYKITPPRLEHRYVKGDFLRPLSEIDKLPPSSVASRTAPITSSESTDDPFAGPALAGPGGLSSPGFPVERETRLLERKLDRAIDSNAAAQGGPDAAQLDEARRQLFALDDQLREMFSQGPGHWRLDEMEQAYRALQENATPGIAGMIDARLDAIASRRKIKAEYDAFVAITTRTDQRDAELVSLQNPSAITVPISPSGVQLGLPQPVDSPPQPVNGGPLPPPAVGPQPQAPGGRPSARPAPGAAVPPTEVDIAQLDGAGIISRLPIPRPGVPQYILVAPDGRLLAYLQADRGVNLDAYLGQSVGVIGRRTQEARLRSDLIIVRQVTPVRLQP